MECLPPQCRWRVFVRCAFSLTFYSSALYLVFIAVHAFCPEVFVVTLQHTLENLLILWDEQVVVRFQTAYYLGCKIGCSGNVVFSAAEFCSFY